MYASNLKCFVKILACDWSKLTVTGVAIFKLLSKLSEFIEFSDFSALILLEILIMNDMFIQYFSMHFKRDV